MHERSQLVTLADVSAYIDEVLADGERGTTSHLLATSRIIGLGALDVFYDRWEPESQELRELMSVAGNGEVDEYSAVECWPELIQAAARLRVATRSGESG
jgi:hypothetical protein